MSGSPPKRPPPSDTTAPTKDKDEEANGVSEEAGSTAEDESSDSCIDMETFNQILDLDDEDETRAFSKEMAFQYFEQADKTFIEMDDALKAKDLSALSKKGHFLKGSSAALGVYRVQEICEKIQNYGDDKRDKKTLPDDKALKLITEAIPEGKKEYVIAEKWLKDWYKENSKEEE